MTLTYSELCNLPTFEERFQYLKLNGNIGQDTFGYDRYLNQELYKSKLWKRTRDQVILRDNGCDLGIQDRAIVGKIIVHHINPIAIDDLVNGNPIVYDLNNLICVSHETHNAIHYGDESILSCYELVERKPNDMAPWKK